MSAMHIQRFSRLSRLYVDGTYGELLPFRPSGVASFRFYSAAPGEVFSFSYVDRAVTLDIRGLPPLVRKRRGCRDYAANQRLVGAIVACVPSCDAVALGVGSHEMALINRHVELQSAGTSSPPKSKELKKGQALLKQYGQYVDVARGAATLGTPVIGIGRSKSTEAASFGDAAARHKVELIRLLSLYLRSGNVLKDAAMLREFKAAAPAIYQAVVLEGAFYTFCRFHECLSKIADNTLCKRRNVKLLVVVDQWILAEFVHLLRTKLPAMLADKSPPMVEMLSALDARSRKGWSRFLVQFVILPMFAITGTAGYQFYSYFYIHGEGIVRPIARRLGRGDPVAGDGCATHYGAQPRDTSRD